MLREEWERLTHMSLDMVRLSRMWTHYIEIPDGDAKGGRRHGDTKRVCRVSSVKEQGQKHGGTYI